MASTCWECRDHSEGGAATPPTATASPNRRLGSWPSWRAIDIEAAEDPGLSEWVEDQVAESDRPDLTLEGVVVSGGRGVGSEEQSQHIEKLAELRPHDWQVGQTGKVVAPELYIVHRKARPNPWAGLFP